MAKHKVFKVKGLFIKNKEDGEVSRVDDYLYTFEEMMVRDLADLTNQGMELLVEVEGGEIEVEEYFRFYVYKENNKLVATNCYSRIGNREHWTVDAKDEDDAIETVVKELQKW